MEKGRVFEVDDELREEAIPDLPENSIAREFLKSAPKQGLWQPLGKEVKVMQCWRCKAYGHRTNDRECPLNKQGNLISDSERQAREDPLANFVSTKVAERRAKYERVDELKRIMSDIRDELHEKKRIKKEKKHMLKKKRAHES
jgi:retinitis pigmentosa 9 protein